MPMEMSSADSERRICEDAAQDLLFGGSCRMVGNPEAITPFQISNDKSVNFPIAHLNDGRSGRVWSAVLSQAKSYPSGHHSTA